MPLSEHQKHQWEEQAQNGEWSTEKGTAGGCKNYPDTFPQNPQFAAHFIVTEDSVEQDGKCTVIVALLQKYRREMRTIGEEGLWIGFFLYQVQCNIRPTCRDEKSIGMTQ
ncbi:calpain large subunit, domain III [Ancylostoma caninum]|uniref:Calpain large subunit, domain III n=1 Tax=Ancylostoma caninum TaxID=29170 RepID=A0A368H1B3_ANCCA|nr:calpain large subunit, domain III [Ancylostoma caninum]